MNHAALAALIPRLAHHRVLVIGDVILDEYIVGSAERMSREAPIPVLELIERRYIPGGAANPASNIVTLGSHALQVGVIGADAAATHLQAALAARGIETDGLIVCPERPTTLKTRILAQMGLRFPQQVARVDTLSRVPVGAEVTARILAYLTAQLAVGLQAALFSDYHTGLLTPELVQAARDLLHGQGILLTADAQGKLEKYAGFDLVKCNAQDASQYLQRDLRTEADYSTAAAELAARLPVHGAMVITRGADGATVAAAGHITHCPAPAISDVYDTVGAGDTAIAVMTLARLAGAAYVDAVRLANYASGIVVRHVGNYTPAPEELQRALEA